MTQNGDTPTTTALKEVYQCLERCRPHAHQALLECRAERDRLDELIQLLEGLVETAPPADDARALPAQPGKKWKKSDGAQWKVLAAALRQYGPLTAAQLATVTTVPNPSAVLSVYRTKFSQSAGPKPQRWALVEGEEEGTTP